MIKRILFDLDDTLIKWDNRWDVCLLKTFEHFNISYDEDLIKHYYEYMKIYELENIKFNKIEMSRWFKKYLKVPIPDDFVEYWTSLLAECVPSNNDDLISLIEYLSSKYSLYVITNWYYSQQASKLDKVGILKYFDKILTAEDYERKPSLEIFKAGMEGLSSDEVVVVGDIYKIDLKPAIDLGMNTFLLADCDRKKNKKCFMISSLNELRRYL